MAKGISKNTEDNCGLLCVNMDEWQGSSGELCVEGGQSRQRSEGRRLEGESQAGDGFGLGTLFSNASAEF